MTIPEHVNSSGSSSSSSSSLGTPAGGTDEFSFFQTLASLRLKISDGGRGLSSSAYGMGRARRRLPTRYLIRNEDGEDADADDDDGGSSSSSEERGTSVSNPIILDEDSASVVKCPRCHFDIEVSALNDAYSTVCPMCGEHVEESVIRAVLSSSFPSLSFLRERTWSIRNSRKSDPSNVDWKLDDNNHGSRGNNKHEPISESLLPPSQNNLYVSSSDVSSDDDSISNSSDVAVAKDISIAKSSGGADAPDTNVNEQDVQERRNKAAFAQELFMSALFLE